MKRAEMPRRAFLNLIGAGTAAAVWPQWGRCETPGRSDRPNVVLIISDDQGYTDYGFMGHKAIRTPRIDKLGAESLLYTRGYVTTALCCPSLGTMLTGLYPHQHRITGNDPVRGRPREPFIERFEKCPRLPHLLARAGYVSFQSGKYWLGHYRRAGFTDGMTVKGRHGEAGLTIGRKTMKPVFDFIDGAHKAGKPFFLWYAPFMPHTPHNPPKRLLDKYSASGKAAAYYAMCEWFDETCGQLLDHLAERGLSDNTMVVYICDNGWPRSVKGSPYELGVRTPIMVRWPPRVKPRTEEATLASSIDIVPTILAACGVTPPAEMPGLNLLDSAAMGGREAIFGENFCHDMADVDRPADSLRARTCIRGKWKLIRWQNPQPKVANRNQTRKSAGDVELYDLAADPTEKNNVAARHGETVKALTKLLNDWWQPNR